MPIRVEPAINAGTLTLNASSAAGSAGVTVANGATLSLLGSSALTIENAITLSNGATLIDNGTYGNALTGGVSLPTSGSNNSEIINVVSSSEILNISTAAISGGNSNKTLNVNSSGSGTLEFSYDNSYFGTTAVNGGILSLAASIGLGDSSATATVYAGSLTLSGSSH